MNVWGDISVPPALMAEVAPWTLGRFAVRDEGEA